MSQDKMQHLHNLKIQMQNDLNVIQSKAGRAVLEREIAQIERNIERIHKNLPGPAEMTVSTPVGEISVYSNINAPYFGVFVDINGVQAALIEHHGDDDVHKIHVWKLSDDDGDDPVSTVIFETGVIQEN